MIKRIPLKVIAIQKVLPFLKQYKDRFGYSPTNREIASKFKYSSAFTGNLLLRELEEAGYIKIPRTKTGRARSRTIEILRPN